MSIYLPAHKSARKQKKTTIPYTYLIGWSPAQTGLNYWVYYYGRRTAEGCHPDELWKDYFTSSTHVADFCKIHGDPSRIEPRKIFNTGSVQSRIQRAVWWEHRAIHKFGAITNPAWLNKRNGKYHTSGTIVAEDLTGYRFLALPEDPRWITGEIHHPNKDTSLVVELATGEVYRTTADDPKWITGEIAGHRLGWAPAIIVETGEKCSVSVDDPRWITGEIVGITKGYGPARLVSTGEIIYVSKKDPRWITGEIVGHKKGFFDAIVVATGERILARTDDPRRITGDIVGVSKGTIRVVVTATGKIKRAKPDDPGLTSGALSVAPPTKKRSKGPAIIVSTGEKITALYSDPRWLTGELQDPRKGKSKAKHKRCTCQYCGIEGGQGFITRYHGERCPENPNRDTSLPVMKKSIQTTPKI